MPKKNTKLTARVGAVRLDLPDEVLTRGNLTEDTVLAVEPRGNDGGDEELRAIGVGTSVSHGEEERSVVTELEVLVGELVAVDGLAASAVVVGELKGKERQHKTGYGVVRKKVTHVTTLEHELGDHSVETRAGVTEAVLAGTEFTEVSGSLGDDIVEELESDSAGGGVYRKFDVSELRASKQYHPTKMQDIDSSDG